jgi:hypothetical protein
MIWSLYSVIGTSVTVLGWLGYRRAARRAREFQRAVLLLITMLWPGVVVSAAIHEATEALPSYQAVIGGFTDWWLSKLHTPTTMAPQSPPTTEALPPD